MTKKELFERLEGLPDDTVIRIPEYDDEYSCETSIIGVSIQNDGKDGTEAEVLLW